MRSLVQNERRVELSFEEHRFWDIRRWKIAPRIMSTPLYGVNITNGTNVTFQTITVASPIWQNKMYHLPIPYVEIMKNKRLIQNEGW